MSFTSFLRGLQRATRPHHNRFTPRLEALDSRDVPATFQATNLADAGIGSLRQAILDANANPGADVIDFAVTGTISLTGDLLTITDGVAINGPGANLLTVERYSSYSTAVGIFGVGSAAAVQLSGLTLTGSQAGAITNYGTLTISDSTLSGNSRVGAGGAIYSSGSLTVRGSTISENYATGYYTDYGFAYGGGIYVAGGTLTLSSSTVAFNVVYGGAYYYVDPDSPYWPNGGVTIGQDAYGGGVYVAGGMVSIDHSTIAGNNAIGGYSGDDWFPYQVNGTGYGSGVYNGADPGVLRIYNSILASNYGTVGNPYGGLDLVGSDLDGSFTSLGHNLIKTSNASGFAASDLRNVEAWLGPLQDNGGPTSTMALLPGSPAINAGDSTGAPTYDQRGPGFPRVFGGAVDIGAFELQTPSLPVVAISDASITEGHSGTTFAQFTVSLTAPSAETVTVSYSTANRTATAGSDYQAVSGTLTFAPGETTKTIAVPVLGDAVYEPNETFLVNLSNPTSAVLIYAHGTGWIVNDDAPPPDLRINDASITEGNSGTKNLTFTVTLSAASSQSVTVSYSTSNGSASGGSDYTAQSGTLTFAPGETTKTIAVPIMGERTAEPDETFFVNLSSPGNAALADSQGIGTILDNEPRISIGDVSKSEGKKGQTTQFTFTVTLDRAYDQAVTVSFRTVNGTATTSNSDYTAKTGTITFAPGETTKTITITVKGDSKREADEYFYLDLFDISSNSLFSKNRGTGWILNDD